MTQTTPNEKRSAQNGRPWLWMLVSLAAVVVDQVSKWLCVAYLKTVGSVPVIPGFLRFTYLENTGAAFGSFTNHRWVFMIFSTVAIVGVTIYLLCLAENNKLLRVSLALIVGGGVGNMIDRVSLGYVIDFLDFHAIWQYIFNIADSCVCVGAGLMVLYSVHALLAEMKTADAAKDQDAGDEPGGDV